MATTMTVLRGLALGGVLALTLGACSKPKAGAACKKEGAVTCVDDKNALVCTGAKWEAEACRSLNGCMSMGLGEGTCTNDGFAEGEPCPTKEGTPGCSVDKKAMLTCTANHWKKVDDCGGQHGCVASASGATCDKGTESEGASCTPQNEGNGACSPDKQKLLLCKGGKMLVASMCRGQNGCREAFNKLECDDSLAQPGDVCDEENEPACSMDKKELLHCKGGKFVKSKACKRCTPFMDKVECD